MKKITPNKVLRGLVLLPSLVVAFYFIWGFGVYTAFLSFTQSNFLPNHRWVGWKQYVALFKDDRWWIAYGNMFIFGSLYLIGCLALGLLLAVLLDRAGKGEILFRTIYLYPMSLSLIVTGLAWQWLLTPTTGLQSLVRSAGFESFVFDWLVDPDKAIYTIAFAAIWHGTGLIMVLFLAGIKAVNPEIWRATRIDKIPIWRVYVHIIIPQLRPILLTAVMLLAFNVVRSFDVVVALTKGGPGFASDVPARYVFDYFFERGKIGRGAAGAVVMVLTMIVLVIPYLIMEIRRKDHD